MKIQSSSPVNAAGELRHLLGWTQPSDFTLDEIASVLGIIVKDIAIDGSEGRILINGDSAVISINNSINNIGKRNFILGHEIGHFLLHKNASNLFSDTTLTLSEWYKKGLHEQQANIFASELLMPKQLFRDQVDGKKLSIALIKEIGEYFGTSLLATFLRYVTLGKYPVMIIFIENGIVKWKQHSQDFPFKYLPLNSKVSPWTVAGDYFSKGHLENDPEKVDAIEWFPEDFQIKYKSDWKLWEQCYRIGENSIVSCLWTY